MQCEKYWLHPKITIPSSLKRGHFKGLWAYFAWMGMTSNSTIEDFRAIEHSRFG